MDETKNELKVKRLEARNVSGAGLQIHADISAPVNCVEFTLRDGWQTVVRTQHAPRGKRLNERCEFHINDMMIAYEPFIQFCPQEYSDMMEKLFIEMAEAWNEKHANETSEPRKDS